MFLVTFAALVISLSEEASQLQDVNHMSREQIRDAILDAVALPIWPPTTSGRLRGGRPRKYPLAAVKLVVFRECHSNGKYHFHVALKITDQSQWLGFKTALRQRHRLASHWSTSHTQWNTAVRYGYCTTPKKLQVDKEYVVWTADGKLLNMAKEIEEPYSAVALRARREQKERLTYEQPLGTEAAKYPFKKKVAKQPFTKLDFYALVETEGFKTSADVMKYSKKHGCAQLQVWVSRIQKSLPEYLSQAKDRMEAEETPEKERLSDWDLIKKLAHGTCECGGGVCQWWEAALEFFKRNAKTIDRKALAATLAGVIRFGPGKTTRVPLIVGATNSAKSTVLCPILNVFGFSRVVHRPGEKASMALANIVKSSKRFIFWDEYRPVEFAARGTVPVGAFLSLFSGGPMEITVSQSFNDGNGEVRWRRGAAMTAKQEGLWDAVPHLPGLMPVTHEDIRHMQTRVRQFVSNAPVPEDGLAEVPQCAESFCRWVLVDAGDFATGDVERPLRRLKGQALPPLPQSDTISVSASAATQRELTDMEKTKIEQNKLAAKRRKLEKQQVIKRASLWQNAFGEDGVAPLPEATQEEVVSDYF